MTSAELLSMLFKAILETLYMSTFATIFAYLFGLPLGIILHTTEKNNLTPAPILNGILGFIINVLRSVPFLILMILLFPITRWIVGSPIGTTASIVPLVISASPLIARMTQATLSDVDRGVIEAARSVGASPLQIITRVMLPECYPSLIQDITISATTILGYSAMAGLVGGGGLGDLAIRFGLYRYKTDVMILTVIVLIVIVQLTGLVGETAAKKSDHRKS